MAINQRIIFKKQGKSPLKQTFNVKEGDYLKFGKIIFKVTEIFIQINGQIINFPKMNGKLMTFLKMNGQLINFLKMNGQLITFLKINSKLMTFW